MNLLALAIAPGIAICLFIFHRDAYNREPKLNLTVTFLLGAAGIIPAYFIEKYFWNSFSNSIDQTILKSFLVIAVTEELVKFLAVRVYAYNKKSFDEPLDGIVYCVVASMGFATVENILYVSAHGYTTGVVRMFLSVPAHATFGVLMGYHIGRAKFHPEKRLWLMFLGLFWAVLFHGGFDALLFLQQSPQIDHKTSDAFLFLGAVASFIVALRLSFRQIDKHRRLSRQTFAPTIALSLRRAFEKDIPLIRKLTYQVWPQTYSSILSKEQIGYMLEKMYSVSALTDQMEKQGHEFLIVNDGKEPVGFASFSLISPGIYKLHKIYILPSQQGRGTGKFVIEQLIRAIKQKAGTALRLNVNRHNKAKDFYEKLGFVVVGEENLDIGNGYFMDDYVMEKNM